MAVDNLSQRVSELSERLEEIQAKCASNPANAPEILSSALESLQASLEELSSADEALMQQSEELMDAKSALQESEERYRSLFNSMTEGFALHEIICDEKGEPYDYRFLDINPGFEHLTGLKREDVIGRTQRDVLPGEDPRWVRKFGAVALTGVPTRFENYSQILRRHYEVFAYRPAPSQFAVVFTDITDRKRAEAQIGQVQKTFFELVERAPFGIYVVDSQFRIAQMNAGSQTGAFRNVRPVIGRDFSEAMRILWPEPIAAEIIAAFRHTLETGEPYYSPSFINPRHDVETVESYEWELHRMTLPNGQYGVVCYYFDSTKLREAEAALRESEEKYRNLFMNMAEEVHFWKLVRDEEGRIKTWKLVDVNPPTLKTWGRTFEEIKGKTTDEIFGPGATEHYMPVVEKIMIEGVPYSYEDYFPNLDKYFRFTSVPLGDHFITTGADITGIKNAQKELRHAHDELEQRVLERTAELVTANEELMAAKETAEEAVRAKAAFLANMSHELRTPMNSVIGFTSILLEEPLSPEHRDYIDTIRINGEALLALINDILDFSRLEKEKIELELHPFYLRQRIEESLDLVSAKAAEKGLDLAYTIDRNVPETIITDSARLRQVLANLLSNAVKFTDKGEVQVEVSSELDDELHFAVKDTGIGIPQAQMGMLFQPFSQINTSISRLNEGTGLGLAISRKLVEMMGGRVWIESEVGRGSTFHFTIKTKAAPEDEPGKLPVGPQPQLKGRSVLIVDDSKTVRKILAHQTHSWGMVPLIVSSGHEALSLIQKGAVLDAAILDVSMPDMDGIALAKTIHMSKRDLPLIMLTSIGQRIPSDLSAASLTKPVKPMQLYGTLTDILAGRPAPSQYHAGAVNQAGASPLRILLAEDNVSSQMVALQMLRRLGYRADLAANGVEVLQALERQHYDVVLMDIAMPEMDGFEATRQIKQRWPNKGPKVIAITAYALEGDRERCLAAGMDDYICKPVKINELADALSKSPHE